jgi:hypothetical protein
MSNAADARYFVDRAEGLRRLEAAVDRRLNAIVFGDRGMGKTSLLQHLVFRARERDAPDARLLYVDGSIADDALGVIELVRDELGRAPDLVDVLGRRANRAFHPREHASEAAMALDLLRALRDAPPATIVLDGLPSPESGHTLFGRLRDELWQLPYAWIVATDPAARPTLLTPPADAFFEVQVTLEPLSIDDQVEMLARRMPEPGIDLGRLVTGAEGNPRRLLALAREAVLEPGGLDGLLERRAARQTRAAELGEPAIRLLDALEDLGRPVSSSDPELLARMEWTRERALQVLRTLEQEGLVIDSRERQARGAPRRLFSVNEEWTP